MTEARAMEERWAEGSTQLSRRKVLFIIVALALSTSLALSELPLVMTPRKSVSSSMSACSQLAA